jgi:alpha-tubulin suppressor-like RCC1 family protein
VIAFAAGDSHTCAVTRAGAVLCWGFNGYGQLGDGTTTDRATPPTSSVLGNVEAVAVAAGYAHTCALTKTKAVRCWGWNAYGQLGNNSLDDRSTPTGDVLTGVEAITAGQTFTCALTTAGAVLCWGDNLNYVLGRGEMELPLPPGPPVPLPSPAKAIAAGESHACAVTLDNAVACWGSNIYGQLGDTTTMAGPGRPTPATVADIDAGCP